MKKIFCIALLALLIFAACGQEPEAAFEMPADYDLAAIIAAEILEDEDEEEYYAQGYDEETPDLPRAYSTLWVGSQTFFSNEMPRQFSDLASANQVPVTMNLNTESWAALHVLEPRIHERLDGDRHFTHVIMAEIPIRFFDYQDEFFSDVERISETVRDAGAIPVLFTHPFSWAFGEYGPNMELIDFITYVHETAAEQSGAIFIDVLRAWAYAYEEYPDLELFVPAGNASRKGAYFTACVLLAELFDLQVTEMPDWSFYTYDGEYTEQLARMAWEFAGNENLPE